jgi:DNA primase
MPGVNAAIKIAKQLYNYHVNLKIVFNSSGMDPDELIKAGEKNQVVKWLNTLMRLKSSLLNLLRTN